MVNKVTGSFTATGQSEVFRPSPGAAFNMTLSGTFVGTVQLERQFEETGGFYPLTALGTSLSFTAPCSEVFEEPEGGTAYRLNCTAYTSGTINYRISQ